VGVRDIRGGDTDAIKSIFGGHVRHRLVKEDTGPREGVYWFRRGPGGELVLWKYRMDSSD
jgi:hypothetical protein